MAVEDIKEYIDEQKSIALLVKDDEVLSTESVVATLDNIRSMLDDLDRPKAHWEQTELVEELYGDIERCTNCGNETLEGGNFCANCGAIMDDKE